jgi:hypothetical protein
MNNFLYLFAFLIISSCSSNQNRKEDTLDIKDTLSYLPFVTDTLGRFIVQASVNNGIGNFYLDTGTSDSLIIIDSTFFYNHIDTTGLVRGKPFIAPPRWTVLYRGNTTVVIGNNIFHADKIRIYDSGMYLKKGDNVVGVIGRCFLKDKIMVVDFDRNRMAFADYLQVDTSYVAVPLLPPLNYDEKYTENDKYVEVSGFVNSKGKPLKGRFLFDTGHYGVGLVLKGDLAKAVAAKTPIIKKDPVRKNVNALLVWSADSLNIATINIGNILVWKTIQEGGIYGPIMYDMLEGGDGLLGMEVIKRFNFIADYKNNILYLKPNNNYYKIQEN